MSTMQIDPTWLTDTITIRRKTGMDDYQKPTYEDYVIKKVRAKIETIYSGTGNNRQITANGRVFLSAQLSENVPTLNKTWLDSLVTIDGVEYVLTRISVGKEIDTGRIWSYTLEVL